MNARTAVIVPALNEAGHIGELVIAARSQPGVDWVIVADNGSTDGTAAAAARAGAQVVTEPRQGYGYACAAGSVLALELGSTILIYMDGDFSSLPGEMGRLWSPIAAGSADLVLGSRTMGQIAVGAMPAHQRLGNWLSTRLMRLLYSLPVTDLGPYRAIRADLFRSLEMREMTFGWPTEMMVKSARRGARIKEVPVSWHTRRSGRSKVGGTIRGSILAAYYILGTTLRYAFS